MGPRTTSLSPSSSKAHTNSGDSYAEWYWHHITDGDTKFTSFHNRVYGKDFTYPQFEKQFTAEMFNPHQWADLFKKSGAQYVVLTSKHIVP